jgi:hypothetical protein
MKTLKTFEQFITESQVYDEDDVIYIDLREELPNYYSWEARTAGEDPDSEWKYTEDIQTTLTAKRLLRYDAETQALADLGLAPTKELPEDIDTIDPSFNSDLYPVKAMLEFKDVENGFGGYGPYGGETVIRVLCGLDAWTESEVLNKFKELHDEFEF